MEADLDDELRFHMEQQVEKNVRSGMTREEALRQARLAFGSNDSVKEECREAHGVYLVESLLQDLRYGLRTLRKSPGFTIVAVLTLALGIGANTAIFSVVQSVLLAPLPYPQSDRLVMVWESNRFPKVSISYPNFLDWRRSARSFEMMAAARWQGYDLTGSETPEHLDGRQISSEFFSTLGVKLAAGREFSSEEEQAGGAPAVVISDQLWRRRFDGDPQAIGKSLTLNGVDHTIVGIVPPGFYFYSNADVYTPLGQGDPLIISDRGSHDGMLSVARLKPGVSLSQAQAEMSTIQNALDQLYPVADRDLGTAVVPLKEEVVGDVSGILWLLLGAVGLVLLIASANVANLLLARSSARRREFAVRLALGATRSRIVRQLITDSLLVSLAGGVLGLALAKWGVSLVLAAIPGSLPQNQSIGVNVPVLLFAFGVSLAVGIVFGLAPALSSSNVEVQGGLKEGGRSSTGRHHGAQNTLVIAQMAMTLVLLAGAGLLLRTIRHLWQASPGFDTQHVITFKVGVSRSVRKDAATTRAVYQQLLDRIRKVPGVEAADFTWLVPLSGEDADMPFWIGSERPASLQAAPRLLMFLTGPDYLRAMGIPLLRGRFLNEQDTTKSPCVVDIDSDFAHAYFHDSNPIGQTLTFGFTPIGPCRIVGVVGHVRHWRIGVPSNYTQAEAYGSLYQDPDKWVPINYPDTTILVRTPLDPAVVMPAIRNAVYGANGGQPVYNVETMEHIVAQSMTSQRFPMILLGTFAGLALLLASVGIYGVISYSMAQRVQEIGIRMALGADRANILRMVLAQGLRLALTGVAIGAIAALILARSLASFSRLLSGVGAGDPITFLIVAVILCAVAAVACYLPARRAMRVDPMVALRCE